MESDNESSSSSDTLLVKKQRLQQGGSLMKKVLSLSAGSADACEVCEAAIRSDQAMVACSGLCCRKFHADCLPNAPAKGNWTCPDCEAHAHQCFACQTIVGPAPLTFAPSNDTTTIACRAAGCGKFYHLACVKKLSLTRVLDDSGFICPLHTCATCEGSNSASIHPIQCMRCPKAFHTACFPSTGYQRLPGTTRAVCMTHFKDSDDVKKSRLSISSVESGNEGNSDTSEAEWPKAKEERKLKKSEKKKKKKKKMKREKKRSRGSDDGTESKADTEPTISAAVGTPQSAEDSPSPKEFKKVQLNITIPDKEDTGSNKDVSTRDKKKKKKKRLSGTRQAEDNVEDIEEQEAKWVQCDSCRKWRTVPQELDLEAMPEKWYCRMNHWDKMYASCDVPEEVVQPKKKRVKTESSGDAPSPSAVLLTTSTATDKEKKLTKKEQRKQSIKTLEKEVKWVQCENVNCGKWRIVSQAIDESSLPTKWYCHLNTWAPELAHCHAENPPEVESVLNKKTTKPKRTKESARSPRLSLTSLDATPDVDTPTSTSGGQSQPLSTTGASSTKAPLADKKQKTKKAILEWAQCEKCNKWRKLPHHVKPSTLPDKWYCSMNHWNVALANCSAPQEEDNEPLHHDNNDYPKTPFPKKKGKLSYRELLYGGNGHIRKAYTEESSTLSFECDGKIYHRDDMYRNSSMYQPRMPPDYPHSEKHDTPVAESIDVVLSMEESVACQKQILRVLHDTTKCRSTLDIVLELNSEAFASDMVFSYPIVQKCLASMLEQGMVESSKEETIVKVSMPLEISTYAKAYYVAGENNHDIRTWEERRPQPQVRYRRKISYRPPLKLAKPWKQKGFLGLPT